jgi:hypothetical protein
MKIGPVPFSAASLAVLVIQLALVSSIAAKYYYQRLTCPHVWTRATAYDPELILRGRYLSAQLQVDGCASTLDSARQANFPRDVNGAVAKGPFIIATQEGVRFKANLAVKDNRLIALRIEGAEDGQALGHEVVGPSGASCDAMRTEEFVNIYLPEHAANWLHPQAELWVEVTLPPQGPPRPIQLALKDHGVWKPLNLQ